MGLLPVTGFYHLGVVVEDIRRSMENFSRVFGIPRWELQELTDADFGEPRVHGRHAPQHFASAVAVGGPVGFELCQPLAGDETVYAEFAGRFGYGLQHAFFSIVDKGDYPAIAQGLEAADVEMAQNAVISDTVDYYYCDTADRIGPHTELLVIKGPNPAGGPPQIVEFGTDVTEADGPTQVERLYRFGVETDGAPDAVREGYAEIYGVKDWTQLSAEAGAPTLAGREGPLAVEIAAAEGPIGGCRMTHMTTTVTTPDKAAEVLAWFERRGLPEKSVRRDSEGRFVAHLLDGSQVLDGCDIEVIVAAGDPSDAVRQMLLAA